MAMKSRFETSRGARDVVSPSPTAKYRQPSTGSRSPSTVSLLGAEARGSLSLSRLDSPMATLRPSTPTYGFGAVSSTRLDLSRTDLMGMDVGDSESTVRSGIEEVRSSVRDLQRQVKQAPRSWRADIEAAVDALKAKLMDSQQSSLDSLAKDLRGEMDSMLQQATRASARRIDALEDLLEANKGSALAETSALRAELASTVQALAKTGPSTGVVQAFAETASESRLALIEQQLQSLKASARGGPDLKSTEAAERKAEAAEQKVAQLEARLREHRSQTAEQFQKIRDSTMTDVAGNLIHQLQAQLEDFKDRQAEALRAGAQNAASLASLEAGLETWRQRLDGAFQESEQRVAQEVEKRLRGVQDRLDKELKSRPGLASEAEDARKKMEKVSSELQQLDKRFNAFSQKGEALGVSVAALDKKVAVAEMSVAEEKNKRDIVMRQLVDRMDQVSLLSQTLPKAARGADATEVTTSPRSRDHARAQAEAQEKELKRVARDLQSLRESMERVSEGQRRIEQEQTADLSRAESSRLEERKGSEKIERKIKARLDELDARLELAESQSTSQELKKAVTEQDARQRQMEAAMQEAQPALKKLIEHEARLEARLEQQQQLAEPSQQQLQQLQRKHLELQSALEGHKDLLEVRFAQRLEAQGLRLEEAQKQLQGLQELGKTTASQVKQVPDLDKRLERSEAQLQEVAKLLSSQEALVQQGVQVQKDLEQLADKQRHFEKNHGDLQKDIQQLQEMQDQLTVTCSSAQAELTKQAKSIGQVESVASESMVQKNERIETSISKLGPRVSTLEDTLKDLIQELGTRLRGLDVSLLGLEPRIATVESQMPRLQDTVKTLSVLSADVKSDGEKSALRFQKLEASLAKLAAGAEEAKLAAQQLKLWSDKSEERQRRLETAFEALHAERGELQAAARRMETSAQTQKENHETAIARVCNFEYRLTAFEVRLSQVEPLEALAVQLGQVEPRLAQLEPLKALPQQLQQLEAQQSSLDSRSAILETSTKRMEAVAEAAAEACREDFQKARLRAEELQREVQQVTKAQELTQAELTEMQSSMEQTQQRTRSELRSNEERLMSSMQDLESQVSLRLEENRTSLDKQTRSVGILQHGRQDLERSMEALKRELHRDKASVAEAAESATRAAQEAAEAAKSAAEASKELQKDHEELGQSLTQSLEKWSLQAQEEAAGKVLEAQELAVNDLAKSMDRQRWQMKEEHLKTREELMQVIKSNTAVFDGKVAELQGRLQLLAAEAGRSLGDLNVDMERLRRSGGDEETMTSSLSLPGLKDLRNACVDEVKRREQESQRVAERLQGTDSTRLRRYGQDDKAAPFTVLDGLKGCEVALTAMDRRVTNLEDCLEDKLYDLVRLDVNKHAAMQTGHLQEMEQKVEKLVHTLHTPSGHESASLYQPPGPLGSRDTWRQQFRSALNDSTYVKRALQTNSRLDLSDSTARP